MVAVQRLRRALCGLCTITGSVGLYQARRPSSRTGNSRQREFVITCPHNPLNERFIPLHPQESRSCFHHGTLLALAEADSQKRLGGKRSHYSRRLIMTEASKRVCLTEVSPQAFPQRRFAHSFHEPPKTSSMRSAKNLVRIAWIGVPSSSTSRAELISIMASAAQFRTSLSLKEARSAVRRVSPRR
jgi:hypothetical protein